MSNASNCCPGTVSCCSILLPATVTATFANTIHCTAIAGETISLAYNASSGKWEGTKTLGCGDTYTLKFYCSTNGNNCDAFRLDVSKNVGCNTTPPSWSGVSPSVGCTCL